MPRARHISVGPHGAGRLVNCDRFLRGRLARTIKGGLATIVVLAAASGCGSDPTPPPSSLPTAASTTTDVIEPTDEPTESVAPPLELTPAEILFRATDGTSVRMTLRLSRMLRANDPAVLDALKGEQPCEVDGQRDAVFVGTVEFTNETPDFSAAINVYMFSTPRTRIGVVYSNGGRCNGPLDFSYMTVSAVLSPQLTRANWGPVPVEIVLADIFSPAHPDGNLEAIPRQQPYFLAYEPSGGSFNPVRGQYGVAETSGPIGAPKQIEGLSSVPLELAHLVGS